MTQTQNQPETATMNQCREDREKANEYARELGIREYFPAKPETAKEARVLARDLAYLRWDLGSKIRFAVERQREFAEQAKIAEQERARESQLRKEIFAHARAIAKLEETLKYDEVTSFDLNGCGLWELEQILTCAQQLEDELRAELDGLRKIAKQIRAA